MSLIIDKKNGKYLSILRYSNLNRTFQIIFIFSGFAGSAYSLADWISRLLTGSSSCNFGNFFTCNATLSLGVTEQFPLNLPILGICYFGLLAASQRFPSLRIQSALNLISPVAAVVGLTLLLWQLLAYRTLCPPCAVVNVSLMILAFSFVRPTHWMRDLGSAVFTLTLLLVSARTLEFGLKKTLEHLSPKELEASFDVVLPPTPDIVLTFGKGPLSGTLELILDPQCPHCADHLTNLRSVLTQLGVSAELRIHWFPIDSDCNPLVQWQSFPNSCKLVTLFNCAGKRREELVTTFFERRALATIAVAPGLEAAWGIPKLSKEIWNCIEDKQSKIRLEDKNTYLSDLGVQGAPVTVFSGSAYEGVFSAKLWRELILKKKFSSGI